MSYADDLEELEAILKRTIVSRVIETRPVQVTVTDAASAGSGMEPDVVNVPGTYTHTRYTGYLDGGEYLLDVIHEQPDGFPALDDRKHTAARDSIARAMAKQVLKGAR